MDERDAEFDAAVERAERLRREEPFAVEARYDRRIGRVMVRLNTGIEIAVSPNDIEGTENARPADLSEIEISPSGRGLHFPRLDADLYLPGLLDGVFGSRRWMKARATAEKATVKKPPTKAEMSIAGMALRNPRELTPKEVQSLAARVLSEGKKRKRVS